jgi:membrane-bound metal-dependent hydrolase YbcI (DUF457 family)
MPSPIGHALGGVIVGLVASSRRSGGSVDRPTDRFRIWPRSATGRTELALCAIAACVPDLDFLWGRHNMETHSVGFALLVGVAVFAWTRSARLACASALAVISHVLFDWLGSDDTPPLGVMALWPLSSKFHFADAFVFEAISRRYWLPNFVTHNLLAVARELAILGPVAAALWWARGSRRWGTGTEQRSTQNGTPERPTAERRTTNDRTTSDERR